MSKITDWLLEGEPWVQYGTRVELLGEAPANAAVKTARTELLAHPFVTGLVERLGHWPGSAVTSHKTADKAYRDLELAAQLGLSRKDTGVGEAAEAVMAHADALGPFQIMLNVPKHFGGSGENGWAWVLTDAPVVAWALVKLGYGKEARVRKAVAHLASLVKDEGWPCAASKEMGRFRGPGKKDDPCPYATLIMTQLLLEADADKYAAQIENGAECLLGLWEQSRERSPYLFKMGTDFRKLKAPLFWYDILHVTDVLTRIGSLKKDKRLKEMAGIVRDKKDAEGRYTPESVYMAFKDRDFGQKKAPSRWLTFLALRMLKRME